MNEDKFFKVDIEDGTLSEDIYQQLAKNMAKAVDIDIANTPLVDLLTGYINYEKLKQALLDIKENINKKLCPNSDYVDYDFGTELLRQELLDIVNKALGDKENE